MVHTRCILPAESPQDPDCSACKCVQESHVRQGMATFALSRRCAPPSPINGRGESTARSRILIESKGEGETQLIPYSHRRDGEGKLRNTTRSLTCGLRFCSSPPLAGEIARKPQVCSAQGGRWMKEIHPLHSPSPGAFAPPSPINGRGESTARSNAVHLRKNAVRPELVEG